MGKLKDLPVNYLTGEMTKDAPPSKTCEICGNSVNMLHNGVHSHSSITVFTTTGDAAIQPFQCPLGEHFTCRKIECVAAALHACIDEHMIPLLSSIHGKLGVK